MSKEVVQLIYFVLDAAQSQPPMKRAALYRGLAKICGDEPEAKRLTDLANNLDQSDKLCREFIFSFSQENISHLQN